MKKLLTIILVTISLSAVAQNDSVWASRAGAITAGCKTSYSKALAIYRWECINIKYDYSYKIYHARECWNRRTGVCNAYSELFCVLAEHCGLEAKKVSGRAKSWREDGHAWVMANTEKGWIMIDPTWGSCTTWDTTDICMEWFNVKPEVLIYDHFPEYEEDQRLATPITYEQFEALPSSPDDITRLGWVGSELLNFFFRHPQAKPSTTPLELLFDYEQ